MLISAVEIKDLPDIPRDIIQVIPAGIQSGVKEHQRVKTVCKFA